MDPKYLGDGHKRQDCLAWSIGRKRVGIEAIDLYLEPCEPQDATHLAIKDERFGYEHVMKVDKGNDRTKPVETWVVRGKISRSASVYQHLAGDVTVAGVLNKPFELDRMDFQSRRFGAFPGYDGELVPMRRIQDK